MELHNQPPTLVAVIQRRGLSYAVVGSPRTAGAKLTEFLNVTKADELIISMPIHDIEARLRSVELFAELDSFEKTVA
jgi:alkanesulfonate monooxygenase SsuD/methylene tetrahydromethanopterin reductase-like flavin-dependent oxidoreductase (luciferase family)